MTSTRKREGRVTISAHTVGAQAPVRLQAPEGTPPSDERRRAKERKPEIADDPSSWCTAGKVRLGIRICLSKS